MNFVERDRALFVDDGNGISPTAFEPLDDFVSISHAATEEQDAGFGRGHCDGEFVVNARAESPII